MAIKPVSQSSAAIKIIGRDVQPEKVFLAVPSDRILSGHPSQSIENYYDDPSAQFSAGIWEGAPGCWQVNYTEHEFCTIISGTISLTDKSGARYRMTAGDHFIIPAGFQGTWENESNVKKIYVIF